MAVWKTVSRILVSGAALSALLWLPQANGQAVLSADDWPTYGRDKGGMRFSPLTQITPANVAQLKVAWIYHMGPGDAAVAAATAAAGPPVPFTGAPAPVAAGTPATPAGRGAAAPGRGQGNSSRLRQSEVTPLIVDGMMYITNPYGKIVALDPVSGKEIWAHEGMGSTRGVEYWEGNSANQPAIIYHGNGGLVSLNAKTGKLNTAFGKNGVLAGEGGGGAASSPPIIYRNIVISGSANPNNDGRDGDIRGFDAVTGKQLWRFSTIPEKGQLGYDTWAEGSTVGRRGVDVWGLMTVDAQRGIVYVPVKAPGWDRYGGDRAGDNLFSNSIVALDATSGKYLWHFQIVHHDIWDFDVASPPALFDVRQNGRTIPALGAISKSGLLFILDRVTGKPIYGVEERPVQQSDIPGERTSPTQPFPVKPVPFTRQTMSKADIAKVTPELFAACTRLVEENNIGMGGPYMPPGYNRPTVNFPGTQGSANWGGMSFNPQLGYVFINTHDLGQITGIGAKGQPRRAIDTSGAGSGNTPNIPYDMLGLLGRFKDAETNMMCQEPPWGSLTAVNVNTGDIAWKVNLGVTDSLPADKQNTGRPNSGGTIATASGLVFVAATDDARFRAFDARTGKELWVTKLPGAAHAVPSTYRGKDGKQYVVIAATGGGFLRAPLLSDSLVAYALP